MSFLLDLPRKYPEIFLYTNCMWTVVNLKFYNSLLKWSFIILNIFIVYKINYVWPFQNVCTSNIFSNPWCAMKIIIYKFIYKFKMIIYKFKMLKVYGNICFHWSCPLHIHFAHPWKCWHWWMALNDYKYYYVVYLQLMSNINMGMLKFG